jgi:S1-C subfamily serine protease
LIIGCGFVLHIDLSRPPDTTAGRRPAQPVPGKDAPGASSARGLSRPGERPERTVEVVPFRTRGGIAAIRVTGVKPGSVLADLGLEAGDVIRKVDSEVVGDPEAFLDSLAEGRLPRSITVLRGAARNEAPVVLGGA